MASTGIANNILLCLLHETVSKNERSMNLVKGGTNVAALYFITSISSLFRVITTGVTCSDSWREYSLLKCVSTHDAALFIDGSGYFVYCYGRPYALHVPRRSIG